MEHDLLPALPECGSGIGIKSYTTTALFATNGQNARPVLGLIVLGAQREAPCEFQASAVAIAGIAGLHCLLYLGGAAYSEGWLGQKPGATSMQMRNVQPQRTRCE